MYVCADNVHTNNLATCERTRRSCAMHAPRLNEKYRTDRKVMSLLFSFKSFILFTYLLYII